MSLESISVGTLFGEVGFEQWHDKACGVFSVAPLRERDRFSAQGTISRFGHLVFSDVRFSAQRFDHDPRVHPDQAMLLLELSRSGLGRGLCDDRPTLVSPEQIHLVERLCRAFNCSRATLYRRFKAVGGVDRHIRTRRLLRCLQAMRESPARRGLIRPIARQWGFDNISHFYRLFRDEVGFRPSD